MGKNFKKSVNSTDNVNKNINNCADDYSKDRRDTSKSRRFPKNKDKLNQQDPFWYAMDKQAIENMASFPWNNVVGDKVGNTADSVPGIVVFPVWHGPATADNSKWNNLTRAANAYFQYMAQGFTGGVNFEAPDLLFSALAAESLMSFMIEGKRAVGMLDYYLQDNKYYAEPIVTGLGFSYKDLIANRKEFISQYNIRVAQINSTIAVPKGFKIGDRWNYLSSWIFSDTESPSYSTLFAYRVGAILKYEGTAFTTGTSLSWKRLDMDVPMSVATFFNIVDELISALTGDDQREMFGALRRVYSDSDLKKMTPMEDDFATTIVRNDIVSASIHNADIIGLALTYDTKEIEGVLTLYPFTQDAEGSITSRVYGTFISGKQKIGENFKWVQLKDEQKLLDMYDHMVNPANVLDITANKVNLDYTQTLQPEPGLYMGKMTCRTEFIVNPYMMVPGDASNWVKVNTPAYISANSIDTSTLTNLKVWDAAAKEICWYSHLDSHTLIPVVTLTDGTYGWSARIQYYLGELDRYTVISAEEMEKLNNKTHFTLLAMPQNSRSVTK